MKIVQICSSIYPFDIGGIERHVYDVSRNLNHQNINTQIITKKRIFQFSDGEFSQIGRSNFLSMVLFLMRERCEIIHIHGWGTTALGPIRNELLLLACKLLRRKIVLTPHGFPEIILNKSKDHLFIKGYLSFTRLIFKGIDKFICVNPLQESVLMDSYNIPKEKIELIPNGIPESAFLHYNKNKIKQDLGLTDKKVLCFVGRLAPNKRIPDLITAVEMLITSGVGIYCIIIGPDAGEKSKIEELISQKELSASVRLYGEVDDESKYMLMSIADLFISPSMSEAFGISTCEAMALGVPVVSANNIGAEYLLGGGEYGLLFKIGDVGELYLQITAMLQDKQLYANMKDKGQQRAVEFRWDKIIPHFEKLYVDLVSKRDQRH